MNFERSPLGASAGNFCRQTGAYIAEVGITPILVEAAPTLAQTGQHRAESAQLGRSIRSTSSVRSCKMWCVWPRASCTCSRVRVAGLRWYEDRPAAHTRHSDTRTAHRRATMSCLRADVAARMSRIFKALFGFDSAGGTCAWRQSARVPQNSTKLCKDCSRGS